MARVIAGMQHRHVDIIRSIKLSEKIHQPKWQDAMSEMLPDDKPVQSPWVNRWVDIEPSPLPLVARWVDIVQVAQPPITERKPEPMVTPRGMAWLVFIGQQPGVFRSSNMYDSPFPVTKFDGIHVSHVAVLLLRRARPSLLPMGRSTKDLRASRPGRRDD
jgi:hypothetical protein